MVSARGAMLAFRLFPPSHERNLCSTNLLVRLNGKIKRGPHVAGSFPNAVATVCLVVEVLLDHGEQL